MLLVETRGKFSKGFRVHIVYAQKFLVAKPFASDQSAVSYGYAVSLSSSPIFDQYSSVVFLRLISTRRPGGTPPRRRHSAAGTAGRQDRIFSPPLVANPICLFGNTFCLPPVHDSLFGIPTLVVCRGAARGSERYLSCWRLRRSFSLRKRSISASLSSSLACSIRSSRAIWSPT